MLRITGITEILRKKRHSPDELSVVPRYDVGCFTDWHCMVIHEGSEGFWQFQRGFYKYVGNKSENKLHLFPPQT